MCVYACVRRCRKVVIYVQVRWCCFVHRYCSRKYQIGHTIWLMLGHRWVLHHTNICNCVTYRVIPLINAHSHRMNTFVTAYNLSNRALSNHASIISHSNSFVYEIICSPVRVLPLLEDVYPPIVNGNPDTPVHHWAARNSNVPPRKCFLHSNVTWLETIRLQRRLPTKNLFLVTRLRLSSYTCVSSTLVSRWRTS